MNNTAIIYKNVKIGNNARIGDFCIIGVPPSHKKDGELETVIGDNAIIRSHTVIYAGNRIGNNINTGHHVTVRESNTIGDNVSIGSLSCIEHHIAIEDGVRIHSQAFIPEYSVLKKNCWIGPNVVLTNAKYPRSRNVKEQLKGPTISENAKIGANVTILPGMLIGKNALVGAGSVVTKNVKDDAVVAGNPAHTISHIGDIEEYNM
jgi:acetyltransferase-like isoleucine patch superfamily enzyme